MSRVRVLIIDQHPAVRQALADRLDAAARIEVLATAPSLDEGLKLSRTLQPDVILLEPKKIDAPRPDSIQRIVRALGEKSTGVIVLTSYGDDAECEAALQAGARRYLFKNIETTRLISHIEAVAAEVAV